MANMKVRPAAIQPEPEAVPLAMSASLANALQVESPLHDDELRFAIKWFSDLEAALRISGPRFSLAHREAVNFHNMAVRRLKALLDNADQMALRTRDDERGLTEIRI